MWGGGLSYSAYRGLWEDLGRCSWARKFARFYVWEDRQAGVLSSVKIYRPRLRLFEREGRCSVLGAIFTPRSLRRQGHAGAMLRAALRDVRRRADVGALLFSDIGTSYYAEFGFEALPAAEHTGRLNGPRMARDPRIVFRRAAESDLEAIRAAHEAFSSHLPIAVVRDAEHWEFLWVRSRSFFAHVQDRSVRHRWRVALRDGSFIGYLITVEGRGEWNIREAGAVDGSPDTTVEILSQAAAEAYRSGLRRVYGWLPGEVVQRLNDWTIRGRPRRRALPMLRVEDRSIDLVSLHRNAPVFIPFQDQF